MLAEGRGSGSFPETYNDLKLSLPLFYPEHKYCGDDGAQNQKENTQRPSCHDSVELLFCCKKIDWILTSLSKENLTVLFSHVTIAPFYCGCPNCAVV